MDILGVGPLELVVVLVVLLIFFGPDRLPELGAKLGRGVRSMRRATRDFSDEVQHARDLIEQPINAVKAPIQEISEPIQEIAQPFQDVKASALALSQAAKAARRPGDAIRDSVMQSMKGSSAAGAAPPTGVEGESPAPPEVNAAEATPAVMTETQQDGAVSTGPTVAADAQEPEIHSPEPAVEPSKPAASDPVG